VSVQEPVVTALVPRITLTVSEAAAALGVSRSWLDSELTELRWIRRGRVKLIAVKELEAWAERNSHVTLRDERRPNGGGV
jgi:hypothetical protein